MGYTVLASGALAGALSHTIPAAGTITPAANRLILIGMRMINGGAAMPSSAAGCGLTFDTVDSFPVVADTVRSGLMRAMDAAPEEGTITVEFAVATALRYVVVQIDDDLVLGANGADAIRNVVKGGVVEDTSLEIAFAAFADAGNAAFAVWGSANVEVWTERTGWTEVHDVSSVLQAQYRADEDTACGVTTATVATMGGIGIELIRVGDPPPEPSKPKELIPQPILVTGHCSCTLTVQPAIAAALATTVELDVELTVQPAIAASLVAAGDLAVALEIIPVLSAALITDTQLTCQLDKVPRMAAPPGTTTAAAATRSTTTEAKSVV
jgi:hypothetical protein